MPLGGVPMGVAIPPILAPMGIASASEIRPPPSGGSIFNTGVRKASIIAAVAVLLTNIEKNAVTIRKPSNTVLGRVPKGLSKARASVTSTPYLDATMASTKPPRKSITVWSANVYIIDL